MARCQILVHRWGPINKEFGAVLTRSLDSSVAQATKRKLTWNSAQEFSVGPSLGTL